MRYLIDTNVLSNLEKEKRHPHLDAWFRSIPQADVIIPINAIFEIQKGIEMVRPAHPDRAAQRESWLDSLLDGRSEEVVAMDAAAARIYAKMVCTPALRNFFLTPVANTKKIKTGDDLAIAAISIRKKAVVVSFNERDFLLIHNHFPLPGLFHPGRLEWCIRPSDEMPPDSETDPPGPAP